MLTASYRPSTGLRSETGLKLLPTLLLNNKELKTDKEKGKCFRKILPSTFSNNSDLMDTEKDIEIDVNHGDVYFIMNLISIILFSLIWSNSVNQNIFFLLVKIWICEVQYKRSFKIDSVNAEWCNI
ncbi:hypothetical protein BpHYR1_026462 [Brachionus plicatilis]|uniref:Uncharacterized protein n=1 Tax=Brachionus plicatilis TaxID=10195 RepID=A0A3M7QX10_BRAPC|nr:hypothetical protein BpHYR1_026462 [Brachionus plicatilis]